MFWLKSIFSLGGLFLFLVGLVGCGKPLQKPVLPGSKPSSPNQLLLGRELNGKDLRELFKVLNEKGEFNSLAKFVGALSDTELNGWAQFLSEWVYEEALSSKGLVQVIKRKIEANQFSIWKKNCESLGTQFPLLFEDETLWEIVPRAIQVLEPSFVQFVLKNLKSGYQKATSDSERFSLVSRKKLMEEIFQLFQNEETRTTLSQLFQLFTQAQWVIPLSDSARELLQDSGPEAFESLAKDLSKKITSMNQALKLARLLNQPAEKWVTVLQEGLRSNPDIIHAVSMKWDPIFIRSLSTGVMQLLLKPEDGSRLDQAFWLSVPRKDRESVPTPEFGRLYSLLYSGLQKISDPRRLEPQSDSGSYRLPLQLNALFLARFLEEMARESVSQIKELDPNSMEVAFWKSPLPLKEFRLHLVKEISKREVDESVKKDLKSLGLLSTLSRLENLVKEEDSGKFSYSVSFQEKPLTLAEGLSEALAVAHSVRPLADITPFLVTLVQNMSSEKSQGGYSLELLKKSPNILTQVQGFLAQLTPSQWSALKETLFEDFKIGQLEIEDRALLVSLFQSDPEVAEWVNEVLSNIQSIHVLDDGSAPKSVFGFYHSFLTKLGAREISQLSSLLSHLSGLQLFEESEEGVPLFPGFYSAIQKNNWLAKGLRALGGLSPVQSQMLDKKTREVFGENLEGQKGSDLLFNYVLKISQKTDPKMLSDVIEKLFKLGWSIDEPEALWLLNFSKQGGFLSLKALLKDKKGEGFPGEVVRELRALSEKKIIQEGMNLLVRIQNERMKEIALTIARMDRSGELISFLDSLKFIFPKGEEE